VRTFRKGEYRRSRVSKFKSGEKFTTGASGRSLLQIGKLHPSVRAFHRALRKRQSAIKLSFQLVLACVVWFAAIGAAFPKSVAGKHCPTAPVQQVVRTEKSVGCCASKGKCVEKVVVSTPRPGESHFQQCLCADKRSKQVERGFEVGSASMPAILTTFPGIALSLEPISKEAPAPRLTRVPSGSRQPSVPPPNAS